MGEPVQGVIEANNSDTVANQLLNGGMIPIDIQPASEKAEPLIRWAHLFQASVSITDLVQFSRQMHSLLRAGVPILSAMTGIANSTKNPLLTATITSVIQNLESGRDLAASLAQFPAVFSTFYVSMIKVGETSGKLDAIFLEMGRLLERDHKTRLQIKKALRYPMFVMIAILIAIVIINIMVIPTFAEVFAQSKVELPWMTKLLIGMSDLTIHYWPQLCVSAIAIVVGWRHYAQTVSGHLWWDKRKLRLPLVGSIIHRAILARFARLFAMSAAAGVPLVTALNVVAKALDNSYMELHIADMQTGLERGESVARTAAGTGMFDSLVLQMISIGEQSGTIDELLKEVATYYDMEVDYDIDRLSAAIEPLLTIVIGGIVLILALGVFLPMWDMSRVAMG